SSTSSRAGIIRIAATRRSPTSRRSPTNGVSYPRPSPKASNCPRDRGNSKAAKDGRLTPEMGAAGQRRDGSPRAERASPRRADAFAVVDGALEAFGVLGAEAEVFGVGVVEDERAHRAL